METTYNTLPPYTAAFFDRLRNYLDLPLYFFGSVQRIDYFNGSDIDVDIFTPNPKSTILQLQHFLRADPADFKRMVWKIHGGVDSNHPGAPTAVAVGHKIMYKEPANGLVVEFSIYDDKYREAVLAEHCYKMHLPLYVSILLIVLKTFYYNLGIIPDKMYTILKRLILNSLVNQEEEHFVIVDTKDTKK